MGIKEGKTKAIVVEECLGGSKAMEAHDGRTNLSLKIELDESIIGNEEV